MHRLTYGVVENFLCLGLVFFVKMKDTLNRTKVVIRHLPPSISQEALMEQIDGRFSGRYNWFAFRPGKISQKNQRHSRAYIEFRNPEDVVEFAEFFDGHMFVNEKGFQFKALVEYAPSQRGPKLLSKKDGREGTIFKDSEYVQFLMFIGKPVENLPSAEIQLERREAERAGEPKDAIIVTPLMDFIRQKRAAKNGSQRSSANGKLGRRAWAALASSSSSTKRGSDKRRLQNSVYISRDGSQSCNSGKDKPNYMLVSRKGQMQVAAASRTETSEDGVTGLNGTIPVAPGSVEIGKTRVVLLREVPHVGDSPQQQNATASVHNFTRLMSNQSQRQGARGKIIRSILPNRATRQSQSNLAGIMPEQQIQKVNSEKGKHPARAPSSRLIPKDHVKNIATHSSVHYNDGKRSQVERSAVINLHGSVSSGDKIETHMRNMDKPDCGVWTPRRSDGVHVTKDVYLSAQQLSDSLEGISMSLQTVGHKDGDDVMGLQSANGWHGCNSCVADASLCCGEMNSDMPNSSRNAESQCGHAYISPAENGAQRHVGRCGPAHGMKEVDGAMNFSEGKPSKRGGSASHNSHERQVWVQKSGSGS